jgi:PIN domain nuclease of toxin-antitoxin system
MSPLLDTCTLLWLVSNRAELSPAAARAIDEAREIFVSAASAFEIGTKHRRGRLLLHDAPAQWWRIVVERMQLTELSITPAVALMSTTLPTELIVEGKPVEHRDAGDRFLVATAASYSLTLVTPDPMIAAYPNTSVLW